MRHDGDSPPSSLRGRLSEVFFTALLDERTLADGEKSQLLIRLGDKAQLDEPILGSSTGLAALGPHLRKLGSALGEKDAAYTMERTIRGADRDVTEGVLELRTDSGRIAVPAAVAMSRERAQALQSSLQRFRVP